MAFAETKTIRAAFVKSWHSQEENLPGSNFKFMVVDKHNEKERKRSPSHAI